MSDVVAMARIKAIFSRAAIKPRFDQILPNCPTKHRNKIMWRVQRKAWFDVSIDRAIYISAHNYIRHQLTDYEAWMNVRTLTRMEARIIESERVDDIFRSWHGEFLPEEHGFCALSVRDNS